MKFTCIETHLEKEYRFEAGVCYSLTDIDLPAEYLLRAHAAGWIRVDGWSELPMIERNQRPVVLNVQNVQVTHG